MKRELFYSVLKYREGLILGESLNAGILFFDPTSNQFTFEGGDLKRVASAYPGLNSNFLKQFIFALESNLTRANESNLTQLKTKKLDEFISNELFFSDAAGLSFDSVERIPISENSDIRKTTDYLKQLFVLGLNGNYQYKRKRNEEYILSEINGILKTKEQGIYTKIERERKITTPLIQYTFDMFWKSNTSHFVKALAFDLENSTLIQNKALQLYGALEQLNSEYFNVNDPATIDLLISKPSNSEHHQEFDKALKIIDSGHASISFAFEDEWNHYVNTVEQKAEVLGNQQKATF